MQSAVTLVFILFIVVAIVVILGVVGLVLWMRKRAKTKASSTTGFGGDPDICTGYCRTHKVQSSWTRSGKEPVMPKNTQNRKAGFALPDQLVRDRVTFAASGAAGVLTDQVARRHRVGETNRIDSRSARLRAAIRSEER